MKTDENTHAIKQGINQLYRQTAKLNLYVSNATSLDLSRVNHGLNSIKLQLNYLSKCIQTNLIASCINNIPKTRGEISEK